MRTTAGSADADAELVALAKRGDREAFEELFRRHYRQVFAVVFRVLNNPAEAEDAVQDAFVRAFNGLRGFRGEAAFGTWLCRIAINVALRRAQRTRVPLASLSEAGGEAAESDPPDPVNMEELVHQRAEAGEIRRAVAALPPKHRAVVSLRYFEGYSCEEISRVLGCSVGTVWSRLHHAHRKLRERLADLRGEG
ncbi:MAG: sigma-70 family RNA polymerase sigma factor [Armatimonadota bacterium]|nr:sigma-70 family RNA polymerase sigma factor [Armatimonadota bacterium]